MIRPGCAFLIKSLLIAVSNTHISDIVVNFHPSIAGCRNWEKAAQGVVHARRDYEAGKIVDVVYVLSSYRDFTTNSTNKPDNVDKNTSDIRGIAAPVEAVPKVVWATFSSVIEVFELVVTFANKIVVADNNTSNGGKED